MIEVQGVKSMPKGNGKTYEVQLKLYIQSEGWNNKIVKLKKIRSNHLLQLDYFDWKLNFAEVLNKEVLGCNGFDLVIANPPYLRIQGIRDFDASLADELVKKYDSATGSFDMYAIFLERGLGLTHENGILNYIMPVKWTNAAFGAGLRGIISEGSYAAKIINFGSHQVFNASTYTGLQWYKKNSSDLLYFELAHDLKSKKEIGNYLKSLDDVPPAKIPQIKLQKSNWVLTTGQTSQILEKLNRQPRRLSDVFEKIFQGLATSKDNVYFLYDCIKEGEYLKGFSKQLNKLVIVEANFTKPLLKGEDVHRYDFIETNRAVIFPYKLTKETAELYEENEIKRLFPLAYSYLKECEPVLRDREKGRLKNDSFWYRYIYPKNLTLFKTPKLIAPEISQGGNFSYDKNGDFYSTTTVYGYIKRKETLESYKCLMAIMNSQLFWWYLVNTGTVLANGYFRYKSNYVKTFPMPNLISKKAANSLEDLVDQIFNNKKNLDIHNLVMLENKINLIVYNLYNLDESEIAIVESV